MACDEEKNKKTINGTCGVQAQIYIKSWALFEEAQWFENRSIVKKT